MATAPERAVSIKSQARQVERLVASAIMVLHMDFDYASSLVASGIFLMWGVPGSCRWTDQGPLQYHGLTALMLSRQHVQVCLAQRHCRERN